MHLSSNTTYLCLMLYGICDYIETNNLLKRSLERSRSKITWHWSFPVEDIMRCHLFYVMLAMVLVERQNKNR